MLKLCLLAFILAIITLNHLFYNKNDVLLFLFSDEYLKHHYSAAVSQSVYCASLTVLPEHVTNILKLQCIRCGVSVNKKAFIYVKKAVDSTNINDSFKAQCLG